MSLDARNMGSQDSLFDVLDFEADFLAVWRVMHEVLECGPRLLEAAVVPLVFWVSERVDKSTEDVAAINIGLLRPLDH